VPAEPIIDASGERRSCEGAAQAFGFALHARTLQLVREACAIECLAGVLHHRQGEATPIGIGLASTEREAQGDDTGVLMLGAEWQHPAGGGVQCVGIAPRGFGMAFAPVGGGEVLCGEREGIGD
jgi:hypothetical protein